MFFAVLPFPTFRIWIVIAFIHFTGSSSRTRTTLTKTLFEKWTLMQKWVANWRTQFNEYCYGWWAAVVAVAPVGTLQSNTVMDLLNWFWFYGISVNMLRSYLWFRFFLLIRTWYLYLSLCCAVCLLLCCCGSFYSFCFEISAMSEFVGCLNRTKILDSQPLIFICFICWMKRNHYANFRFVVCVSECVYVFIVLSLRYTNKPRQPNEMLAWTRPHTQHIIYQTKNKKKLVFTYNTLICMLACETDDHNYD